MKLENDSNKNEVSYKIIITSITIIMFSKYTLWILYIH